VLVPEEESSLEDVPDLEMDSDRDEDEVVEID